MTRRLLRSGRNGARLWLVAFAIALSSTLVAWAGPARAPLTLAEYRAGLLRARAAAVAVLRELSSGRDRPSTWQRVLTALPRQVAVRLPSGTTVPVDNEPVAEQFSRSLNSASPASRRAGIQRFIAAVDRLLAATRSPAAALDRARADRALRSVLRRPEFQTEEPGPTWEDRFIAWLDRLIRRLSPRSSAVPAGGEGVARLMMAVVVLLLAILVARILMLVLPNLRRRREEPAAPSGTLVLPSEPDALLAAAEAEAAAGQDREAFRLAFLATVARLDRAGVLPEDRSRTHWELLRELRRAGQDTLYQPLAPLARRLDERLFGGRMATVDDYAACRQAYDQIERLLCAPA